MAEREKFVTEIDPITGFPREDKPLDPSKAVRLGEQKDRAELLRTSLASETGQEVLRFIQEHLLTRVKVLMLNDPECKVMVKLLADMGITIDMGKSAVERMMRLVVKK